MVVNKPILQDIENQNQKIKTILLQIASSVHYCWSVHGHRKDTVWNTTFYNLDVYNIHQNLTKQYNDRTDLIINIILLSIGK